MTAAELCNSEAVKGIFNCPSYRLYFNSVGHTSNHCVKSGQTFQLREFVIRKREILKKPDFGLTRQLLRDLANNL